METDFQVRSEIDLGTSLETGESKGQLMQTDSVTITPNGGFNDTIITAQPVKMRRNIKDFLFRMEVLADRAGEEYRYQWEAKNKKKGTKEVIEGPSIKLANDLAREYGNCMVDCRVVAQGNDWIFYARFIDLETGYCLTRPLAQRRKQDVGMGDADRAADIVFQIGASKAIRNVVVNALQTYADIIYDRAKNSLIEQIGKKLDHWKQRVVERCEANKWNFARVEHATGKVIKEWNAKDVAGVIAQLKSVADGMSSFDDLFPDPQATGAASSADLNKEFIKPDNVVDVKPGKPASESNAGVTTGDASTATVGPATGPDKPSDDFPGDKPFTKQETLDRMEEKFKKEKK